MSAETTRPSWWSEVVDTVKTMFLRHGGIFTAFAVVFILLSGITLINNPANWWMIALVVVALFFTIFLFLNARVIIKSTIAIVMTIMLSSFGFSIGAMADPYSQGAIVWSMATLFMFFAGLSLSYLIPSGRSRWGSVMVAQILFFTVTATGSIATGDVMISVVFGVIFGLIGFSVLHFLTGASRSQREHMPLNVVNDRIREKLAEGAEKAGFDVVDLSDPETDRGALLVWREQAYLLYPVEMEQSFSIIGRRKKTQLGYKKRAVNPWLLHVAFKETPAWRARGADIMTVLIDIHGNNGGDAKVIGAALPDTKKVLPVGVLPGRILKNNDAPPEKLFDNLNQEFHEFVEPLTDKQRTALDRMKPEHTTTSSDDETE